MTDKRQYGFLQDLAINGQPVAVESVLEMAYIENADNSGTKLILTLDDTAAVFRDGMGVEETATITLTLSDMSNGDEQQWVDEFTIAKLTTTSNGNALKLECFQTVFLELKTLVSQPRFFVNQKPAAILAALLPNSTILADEFAQQSTYHLNAGGTKSKLIRQIARDCGAVFYYCRGKFYFRSIKNLFSAPPAVQIEYGNPLSRHEIYSYKMLGNDTAYSRIVDKSYISWDCVRGMETADTHKTSAKTPISCAGKVELNNQSRTLMPVIDLDTVGFGGYAPCVHCALAFYKNGNEIAVDESIPKTAVISRVTHFVSGMRYLCRVELSVSHE